MMRDAHNEFISACLAFREDTIDTQRSDVATEIEGALSIIVPSLEEATAQTQTHIEDLMFREVYPKFVRYQMSVSAAKALSKESAGSKYGGLGDCFILTDPNQVSWQMLSTLLASSR